MHKYAVRISTILSAIMFLVVAIALLFSISSYYLLSLPAIHHFSSSLSSSSSSSPLLHVSDIEVYYPKPFAGALRGFEYAMVEFNLTADLRSLWNWNVRK